MRLGVAQARLRIVLEEEELVGLGELNLLDELPPVVGAVALGQVDDRAEAVGLVDAAQVAGGEAQPLEHGQLLGGQFLAELLALVGPGGVLLDRFAAARR